MNKVICNSIISEVSIYRGIKGNNNFVKLDLYSSQNGFRLGEKERVPQAYYEYAEDTNEWQQRPKSFWIEYLNKN